MVPRTVNAAAHPCFRGFSRRIVPRTSCPYRLHVATRHGAARAAKWSRRFPWCCALVCCRSPMVPRAGMPPRICVAAHPCCRALVNAAAQLYMLPRTHGAARSRTLCRLSLCCRVPCCRAVLCVAASHVAAQFSVLPRPMLPPSSTCCRVPCCRAVLRVAASHGATQFSVLPRPMFPRSSTCGRASVLSAAQFYVLPRPMVPRAAQRSCLRLCCRAVVWFAIKERLVPQSESVVRQLRWRLVVVG